MQTFQKPRTAAVPPSIFSLPALTIALFIVVACVSVAFAGSDDPTFTKSKYPEKKMVDKEFSLTAGGVLRIDVDDMDIHVKNSDGKTSRVQVFVAGPDQERAVEFFEEHLNFELGENDNELTMTSEGPRYHSGSFWKKYRRVHIWAIVTVPSRFDADITTDDGDLRVDALEGRIKIRTEDGNIEARDLRGSSIDVKSSDGDVTTSSLEADEVIVDTSDGDIIGERFHAKHITVRTSDGDIMIERLEGGEISIRSQDGDIEVGVSGDELTASCSDGDMEVTLFDAMAVDLRARDGDIRLSIPQSLHVDLELKGDDVSVRGGTLTKGDVSSRGVVGSLNKGGPLVRAKSNDGTIALRLH